MSQMLEFMLQLPVRTLVVLWMRCRTELELSSRIPFPSFLTALSPQTFPWTFLLVFLGTVGTRQPLPSAATQQQMPLRPLLHTCLRLLRTTIVILQVQVGLQET